MGKKIKTVRKKLRGGQFFQSFKVGKRKFNTKAEAKRAIREGRV